MSGFGRLFLEAAGMLALAAIAGTVVGWSFGALRASRTTTERYEQQIRATLRRMSDAEAEAVTLRGLLEERDGVIAAQKREHESREHLLAAVEARLAEAEGAGETPKGDGQETERVAIHTEEPPVAAEEAVARADRRVSAEQVGVEADAFPADEARSQAAKQRTKGKHRQGKAARSDASAPTDVVAPARETPAEDRRSEDTAAEETVSEPAVARQNGDSAHLEGVEAVVARTAGSDEVPNDDLTRIKGIGKVIEGALKDLGITSYRQIANLSESDIDVVEQALDTLRGRIRRDDWMSSAAELHESTYGAEV